MWNRLTMRDAGATQVGVPHALRPGALGCKIIYKNARNAIIEKRARKGQGDIMRIFALELDNDVRGIARRKGYMEGLIARLPSPDLVVLPELSLCGYMANQGVWRYADDEGTDASAWATEMARTYDTYIGVGYLDRDEGDYYNRYLIAGPDGVCGTVTKSEVESAVFKGDDFGNVIDTPFGKVGVAICVDSRRRGFYDDVMDEELSLILFPHGAPANPDAPVREREGNFARCMAYVDAFGVPVVYANSKGGLDRMPGITGWLMERLGFRLNGMSRIYAEYSEPVATDVEEAVGADVAIRPRRRRMRVPFHGDDILPGNWLFRNTILKLDAAMGARAYEAGKAAAGQAPSDGDGD